MKLKKKPGVYLGWAVKRLMLALTDIIIVNLSYFIALVIRFYVNNQFRPVALERYLPAFQTFAPYYTVICLVVFVLFKLYNNLWKHAGLHDLNRVFLASAVTAAAHVAGTLMFVDRMPITYYVIGAVLQLFLITASRFGYRLFVLETKRLRKMTHASLNVMIAGTGETARILRHQIENDSTNVAKPVCIFSYHGDSSGGRVNGLPLVAGVENLPEHLKKYQVKCVILADSLMPEDVRRQIRQQCQGIGVEVQDFSGFLNNDGNGMSLRRLMERIAGPVEIRLEGDVRRFDNGEQALMALPGTYEVKTLSARENLLVAEIRSRTVILNNTNEDWVRDTEDKTGEEISFF